MSKESDRVDELRGKVEGGRKLDRVMKENKRLKDQLKETTEQLEEAREARRLIIPERKKSKNKPETFARLIIGDSHGSHAEPEALRALLDDVEKIDVREIVHLGDALECGGWLMQKHVLGYVAQMDEVVYEDDVAATGDFFDALQKAAPNAEFHYMEGNHEQRVERWCVDVVEGNKRNAEFLMRAVAPRFVLNLEERGINYYKIDEQHSNLPERGILKLGHSYFTHGFSTAKHAASKHVEKVAGCVFYGHTHRADHYSTRLVNVGLVSAWCPGCLCDIAPRWRHSDPSGWTQGYILQIVNSVDETFHAIHVPIDNGRSYLMNLLDVVGL